MDNFSLCQSVMGQTEYEALRGFYVRSWADRTDVPAYTRRVYITRRSFNLNDHFFRMEHDCLKMTDPVAADRLDCLRRSTFLTQSALFAYVPKWTRSYLRTKRFSPILIVDELIVYGREISSLMYTLEALVCSVWQKETGATLTSSDEWDIHNALTAAVDILVFATNKQPLLLANHLKSKLHTERSMSVRQWREYIQNVSRLISADDEQENTSYAPSFTFDKRKSYNALCNRMRNQGWYGHGKLEEASWTYHGSTVYIWQRNAFPSDPEGHLHLTVRCHWLSKKRVRMIPLPIFGDIAEDRIEELFFGTAQCLSKVLPGSALAALLHLPETLLRKVKLQLISCVISIIQFFDLFPTADSRPVFSHDLLKIAQNFGTIDEVYLDFQVILGNLQLQQELRQFIYSFLRQHTQALYGPTGTIPRFSSRKDDLLAHADNFFYRVGMDDEAYVHQLYEEQSIYSAWMRQTMSASLKEYLYSFKDSFSGCTFVEKLSTLLPMMDAGIVSMNMGDCGITLKVGEQSKFYRVRQLYRYMPALIELERYCLRAGRDKKALIIRFGEYLDRIFMGENFARLFQIFVIDEIYQYSQFLRDWDIDLVSGLDKPDRERGIRRKQEWSGRDWGEEWKIIDNFTNDIQYLHWERTKQKEYKQLATEFCMFML